MRTGENGRIAIYWDQTEIDGLEAAPMSYMRVGATWSWRGQARFLIEPAEQAQQRTGGVQGVLARTLGHFTTFPEDMDAANGLVVLTNGAQSFTATLFLAAGETTPTLVFESDFPARDQEFWISEVKEAELQGGEAERADDTVIAFPTRPRTDDGIATPERKLAATAGRRGD